MQLLKNLIFFIGGCKGFRSYKLSGIFKVFLPNIKSGIIAATLFTLIPSLGSYAVPKLVGGTNATMLGNIIAQHLTITRNWPLASTISASLIIITSVAVWIFQKWTERRSEKKMNKRRTSFFSFVLPCYFLFTSSGFGCLFFQWREVYGVEGIFFALVSGAFYLFGKYLAGVSLQYRSCRCFRFAFDGHWNLRSHCIEMV